jgi:ABC-type multidrug transport system fused ATPase/permease subunit
MNIKKSTSSADTDAYSSSSTPPPIASSKPSLWKLFHLAMPEMPMLLLSFILMIGSEATNMITPLIVANAYDVLVDPTITNEGEKMSEINGYMLIAIIITIVGIIAGFLRATIQGIIGERVVARLRCNLYKQILYHQEISFFDEHKSGELVSRLGSDTTLLQSVVSQSLPDFLAQFIKAIAQL